MKYPEYVRKLIEDYSVEKVIKIDEDCSEDSNFRYEIAYRLSFGDQKDRTLIVLMMNPSKANTTTSDRTINRILDYAVERFEKVVILNSLPMYQTKSEELKHYKITKELINKNLEKIAACLMSHADAKIVLSTGIPTTRAGAESITHIYDLLSDSASDRIFSFPRENKEDEKLTIKGYPRHISRGSHIAKNEELIPFDLNNYDINQ